MMLMQVTCPHCGARYQFERSLIPQAGYDAQCANCSGIFVVAPDSSGHEAPIALPSMSMIDTWLAPPALAPKSTRNVASQGVAGASRVTTSASSLPAVEATPQQGARSGHDAPATVTVLPVGGRGAPAVVAGQGDPVGLQFSVACPACDTVYAFAVNDIPRAGVDAPCTQCAHPYRLTRVGDSDDALDSIEPDAAPDSIDHDDDTVPAATALLRPLEPEVLHDEISEPGLGKVLGEDAPRLALMHGDEDTTPDGDGADTPLLEQLLTDEPVSESIEGRLTTVDDAAGESPTGDHRVPEPPGSLQPVFGESIAEGPTAGGPVEPPIPEEITKPFAKSPVARAGSDEARVVEDAPTPVPRDQTGPRAFVPLAASERSRAGAASWGPPDPQAVMRSRVRTSGEGKERVKNRRPPFDDDDVARLRKDGKPRFDPREFDDEDSVFSKIGLRGKHRIAIVGALGLVLAVSLVFVMVPLLSGKSVLQILHLRTSGDLRLQELTNNARAALLADTDVGYRDATKAANDILDIDPSNVDGRVIYGIASVFRGVDVRAAAQNMVAEGEVVQSSQMLATASAELAHARRVLSRKNDESAELAFTAGIYYALDEDQRALARDAYARGMRLARVAEDAAPPTPYAAYLQATLRNLEGDAAGARASLERAMTLEPRWQRPRFELARLEAARGEVGRARDLATEVVTANADHLKAKDLLAVLPEAPAVPAVGRAPVVPKPADPPPAAPQSEAQAPKPPPEPKHIEQPKAEQPRRDPPAPKPVPEAREGSVPDIQTPPDSPTIIRGAPPPFQPPVEPAPEDDGAAPPETQN